MKRSCKVIALVIITLVISAVLASFCYEVNLLPSNEMIKNVNLIRLVKVVLSGYF